MSITENLINIKNSLPDGVKLAAVSKTHSVEEISEAYNTGHRCFAESKAQELNAKYRHLPADIEWHFIGHLQSNKVKTIAPVVSMIHSVDSMKLLKTINKEAVKNQRVISCLLQFHIADEDTKFGLDVKEAEELLTDESFASFKNIRISGVMGMATFTDDKQQVSKEFRTLKSIFQHLKENYFKEDEAFCEISMGMSDDFRIAIEEGSTIIRVGSLIFGSRNYN